MGEHIGKARGLFHFQQHIGNPHIWQTPVEIKDKLICFSRDVGGQTINFQDTISNGTTWDGTGFGGNGQTLEAISHAHLALIQPFFRIERNSQSRCGLCCCNRHQSLLQIAVTSEMGQSDIARPEGIAQVGHYSDFP